MSGKLHAIPLAITQLIAAGAFSAGVVTPASAQSTAQAEPPITKVEITGSFIRRADAETPSPVQVITAADLKNSGYNSVADVLQHITANGAGTLSQTFSGGFAAGGAGISLRGLNDNATLVLIDGHRMAPYPLADDGSRSFVDISNIPFDAVERIEILKDGASAVYGSDAMAGVVNVILKKNLVGTFLSAEGGRATQGGGGTSHATISHGMGDIDKDGYNAYFSAEYRHQNPIRYNQRLNGGDWQALDMSAYGGSNKALGVITPQNTAPLTLSPYFLNPNVTRVPGANNSAAFGFFPGTACSSYAQLAAGGCAYDDPYKEIQPKTENINLLASLTKDLGGGWQADFKASMFESKVRLPQGFSNFPSSYGQQLEMQSGVPPHYVDGTAIPTIRVPANYPGNPFGVPAILRGPIPGAPDRNITTDSKAYRLVADLRGTLGVWDIDAAIGYTRNNLDRRSTGNLNVPALNAALNRPGNPYLVYGPNTPEDLAAIFRDVGSYDTSELNFVTLQGSRPVAKLPGGDLVVSVGAEVFKTKLSAPAMPNADGHTNGAYAFGSETASSAHLEFVAPLLKNLEFDGAVRFDHYSLAGNATTPKVAFKYMPSDAVALRGTLSKGFRAPGPAENGNSASSGGVGSNADPVLCPSGYLSNGQYPRGTVIASCNESLIGLSTTNPDLKPEKSVSATLGLILEPVKGWSTAIDLYQITVKDQIVGGPLSGTPVRNAAEPSDCADGLGGTYTCTPSVGRIAYYPATPINANSTRTRGVEFDTRYRFNLGDYGRLKTEFQIAHAFSYVMNIGGQAYELAGGHGPAGIGADTANPKDRAQLEVDWEKGKWEVATTLHWISSYNLTDPTSGQLTCADGGTMNGVFPAGNTPEQFCKVRSFLETDLAVHYKLDKQWTLHASVTNLFNQAPPVDVSTYGSGRPYNLSLHTAGAIGRFVNVGLNYTF
ncbi:iron complex outermembrane receptor protein [Duganella sp. 1224]|uniref:TonB-dependent receptor plug domain-containing protein n=1 Tax=Duganella sp. 1224 TaxID=2587052 RepID=UPI0015CEB4F2|nr:TonB-dependent receptor [Duganella sp. 1224]NYE63895.1 iron complex outermembrane receptor protein [Duganella sp. 1224]